MHRFKLLQQACERLGLPTRRRAGRACLSPIHGGLRPQCLDHHHDRFCRSATAVILKTIEGMAGTRKVLVNVGRSFNLTATQQFWKILFPAALPTIFVGVRLGLIFALINVVGVEFLINYGGLGQLINDLAERYDLAGTYAAICFVILVSVLFFMTLEKIERWLRPVD